MKIIIAGGSGFLGENLEKYFSEKGNQVYILTRNPKRENEVYWDARTLDEWKNILENSDVLINLTEKSVDCRYHEKNKQEIHSSRIDSTKVLQQALDNCLNIPKVWLNASSATIYVHSEKHLNTEEDGIVGDDFSMNICKSWEEELFRIKNEKIRKVALRTSIVLGKNGGAFPKLRQVTKSGLGGNQGRGDQKVSWIHIDDFCRVVEWIIDNENIGGAINVTAPQPLSNEDFMKKIRNQLKVPFGVSSPVWLLEIASIFLGTETELLLKSRNVYPEKLIANGFQFIHPNIDDTLQNLLKY